MSDELNARAFVTLVDGPTGAFATPAEVGVYLGGINVSDPGQDALLETLMKAAQEIVDGWNTYWGWCFRPRTLRLDLEDFDGFVELPGGKSTVTEVRRNGEVYTGDYGSITRSNGTRLCLQGEADWRITYTVGDSEIPADAKLAYLRLVGTFWTNRAAMIDAKAHADVANLLRRFKVRTDW